MSDSLLFPSKSMDGLCVEYDLEGIILVGNLAE